MKKILITGLSVLFVALALFSCGSDNEPKDKPTPAKATSVEVLLNGLVVKNGAEVASKELEIPPIIKDENGKVIKNEIDFMFSNKLIFNVNKQEQLGKYTFIIKKVGEGKGKFFQVCSDIDKQCKSAENNVYTGEVDIKELKKDFGYDLKYTLGTEKPTENVEAKLSVELMREGKQVHHFTIKMTYKP